MADNNNYSDCSIYNYLPWKIQIPFEYDIVENRSGMMNKSVLYLTATLIVYKNGSIYVNINYKNMDDSIILTNNDLIAMNIFKENLHTLQMKYTWYILYLYNLKLELKQVKIIKSSDINYHNICFIQKPL